MTAATAPASCTPRGTQTSPDVFKAPSMSTTPAMSLDGHKKFVGSPYKNKVSRQGLQAASSTRPDNSFGSRRKEATIFELYFHCPAFSLSFSCYNDYGLVF